MILKQRRTVPTIASFIEPIQVFGCSLTTPLREHQVKRVDLLQIDTEGFDFEIIKMLWDTPIRPSIINFESTHLKAREKVACAALLRDAGYRYVTIGRDTIALRAALRASDG